MVDDNDDNFDLEIPKNVRKGHEQFMFHKIIPSNSTIVGETFETLGYKIPKYAMKSHE